MDEIPGRTLVLYSGGKDEIIDYIANNYQDVLKDVYEMQMDGASRAEIGALLADEDEDAARLAGLAAGIEMTVDEALAARRDAEV